VSNNKNIFKKSLLGFGFIALSLPIFHSFIRIPQFEPLKGDKLPLIKLFKSGLFI